MNRLLLGIAITGIIVVLRIGFSGDGRETKHGAEVDNLRLAVTAEKLRASYDANEAEADRFYGPTPMAVRGRVQSIHKEGVDRPYLTLEPGVRAELTLADSALAVLVPGDQVVVACSGANVIKGIPVLRDCALQKHAK